MKIAVASDDGVSIAQHTGRCRGFVIYETADSAATRLEQRANGFTAHARGECSGEHTHAPGESHHSHGPLVDALADCAVLVTRGLGQRLVADLEARGIQVYLAPGVPADDAAQLFAQGRLLKIQPGQGCSCHHH